MTNYNEGHLGSSQMHSRSVVVGLGAYNEPQGHWSGEPVRTGSELVEFGSQLVDPETDEVLESLTTE